MFTLVTRCAESITQPCQLKVKVRVQGHWFEPWISCPLCISFTPGRIISKRWSNFHLWDDVQNTLLSHEDSRTKSQFKIASLSPELRVHSISPLPLEGFSYTFGQMFASVKWCAETVAQPCRLTRSQFKVTGLSLEICVRSVSPLPLGGFSQNFGQMFTSVGQCAEPIIQPCGRKVKVTVEGHEFEPWIWCWLHICFTPKRTFFKR